MRVACSLSHVVCCLLRVKCCVLSVACCMLSVACRPSPVVCCRVWSMTCVACCVLRAACCMVSQRCRLHGWLLHAALPSATLCARLTCSRRRRWRTCSIAATPPRTCRTFPSSRCPGAPHGRTHARALIALMQRALIGVQQICHRLQPLYSRLQQPCGCVQ
jgi:hypothetical protein